MLLIHKINASQIISLCSLIVWLRLALGRLLVSCDDWCFENLGGSHHQGRLNTAHDFFYGCQMVCHYYQQQPSSWWTSPGQSDFTTECLSQVHTNQTESQMYYRMHKLFIKEEGNRIKSVSALVLQFHSNVPTNLSCSSEKFSARSGISEPFTWMRFARLKIFTCRYHYKRIKQAFSFTFKWIGFKNIHKKC